MKSIKGEEFSLISSYINLLIHIGKLGGVRKPVFLTTAELGAAVGISQQSASRKLSQMEEINLIVRNYSFRGNSIKITSEGLSLLEYVFTDLWSILTVEGRVPIDKIAITGIVCTGMGEGAYYMNKLGYKNQFPSIIGFTPFPGTLNLQLIEEASIRNFELILRKPAEFIKEFVEDGRMFGKVFVWPVELLIGNRKLPAALIRPDRTHHNNQIELIVEMNVKEQFGVKDGDKLEIVC